MEKPPRVLGRSQELTGYRAKVRTRDAFRVTGYTLIVPPGRDGKMIPRFWDEIRADGRLQKLREASLLKTWILGLGSWDPECPQHGQRYTICIEETEDTDFEALRAEHPLFTKEIGASDWLCFEMTERVFQERFWKDDPYRMMGRLGLQFHTREGSYDVGLHFDAYPPDFGPGSTAMEFWITVI